MFLQLINVNNYGEETNKWTKNLAKKGTAMADKPVKKSTLPQEAGSHMIR